MLDFTELFQNLKHTLEGKFDILFLVNDSTNEIRQHFDANYPKRLNISNFIESQNAKKNYLNDLGINYGFFIIPDKSIIFKDCLPFDYTCVYRYVDQLGDCLYDLSEVLTQDDYISTDTNLSKKAYIKVMSFILSKFTQEDYFFYNRFFKNKTTLKKISINGDLILEKNWSYDFDSHYESLSQLESEIVLPLDTIKEVKFEEIPSEYNNFFSVKSRYYRNENSLTDKKALVFYDAKVEDIVPVITAYYNEVFFYKDKNYFYKELIEWFKPDDVIELRIERFLDKIFLPFTNDSTDVLVPVQASIEKLEVKDRQLHFFLKGHNLRGIPLNADYDVYIDGDHIVSGTLVDGFSDVKLDISQILSIVHEIRVVIKNSNNSKSKILVKQYSFGVDIDEGFNSLRKTLKGKSNVFFLVNDTNKEIPQHYDSDYESTFDRDAFIKSQTSKMEYFSKKDIRYAFFIVPDKSIILRKYLPFDTCEPRRNVDGIRDYVHDLISVIEEEDYLINDTHISPEASLKVIPQVLSVLYGNSRQHYEKLLKDNIKCAPGTFIGDLFFNKNWSYGKNATYKKYRQIPIVDVLFADSCVEVDREEIPEKFRKFSVRDSVYLRNPDSISDQRVLIFHGSSIVNMRPALSTYFREVFCYWDYSYFNRELIEWFKPDVVFEFRIERFLENIYCPIVYDNKNVLVPVGLDVKNLSVDDSVLNISLEGSDLRGVKLNTSCQLFIDENLVKEESFIDGRCDFVIDVSAYVKGEHSIRIYNKASEYTKYKQLIRKVIF